MTSDVNRDDGFAAIPIDRSDVGLSYVGAELDGQPLRLIVDTGANRTILDKAAAERLGVVADGPRLEVAGCLEDAAAEAAVRSLRVGPVRIPSRALVVLDLAPLRPKVGDGVDGILGVDVLVATRAIIDFGRDELRLLPPGG